MRLIVFIFLIILNPFANLLYANAPPAPTISAALVEESSITEWLTFSGRLSAVDEVALRPRVSGQISAVHFEEGGIVQEGELLFKIDERPFAAAVNQAQALLDQASTQAKQAEREAARGKDLLKRKVISKESYESRTAAAAQAQSEVAAAQAALEIALLNLEFTQVVAPVTGRVSLALVTPGNWVQAGQTLLTQVVSTDFLYVDIMVDERSFLQHLDNWVVGETKFKFGLLDDDDLIHTAVLTFIDNQIDSRTGTIKLRAKLANPAGHFRPGLFIKAAIPGKGPYQGVLINDVAIASDQGGRYVLVVDDNNLAQYRTIHLGPKMDGLRVIRTGLTAGEKIIVNGLMKAMPGTPVNPEMVDMHDLKPIEQ